MNQPLVSCLMPTYNRREFIPRAIRNFQAQTYPNLELIVVDDGTDRIADLIPRDDDRIKYFFSDDRDFHGQKMNLAFEFSRGDFGVVFDDDDCYSPDRVSRQIDPLLGGDKVVSGTSTLYYYQHGTKTAFLFSYPAQEAPWIGSLAIQRDYQQKHPFKDIRAGADFFFLKEIPKQLQHDLHDPSLVVAAIHGDNADPKKPTNRFFSPVEWETLPEWFLAQ
jgi:glycosyltransferase involved in cell wall biosynthesis